MGQRISGLVYGFVFTVGNVLGPTTRPTQGLGRLCADLVGAGILVLCRTVDQTKILSVLCEVCYITYDIMVLKDLKLYEEQKQYNDICNLVTYKNSNTLG